MCSVTPPSPAKPRRIDWRWGVIAAIGLTLVVTFPQVYLLAHEFGSATTYAIVDMDEVAYSAYLQSLITGHPRTSNPYTDSNQHSGRANPESLFSIQFATPYLIALAARFLHLSASTIFVLLLPIVSISSSLVLFWLLMRMTNQLDISCAGTLIVLCLPALVSGQGPIGSLFGLSNGWSYLTFSRRYIPAFPFPIFLGLLALTWHALTSSRRYLLTAAFAALSLSFLIFSYFYLWTAACAWLAALGVLWFSGRPSDRQRALQVFGILGLSLGLSILGWFVLLSHRPPEMDQVQILTFSHRPDLFRPSELLSIVMTLVLITIIIRGRLSFRDPVVLTTLSLLFVPVMVFNQQVITGRSLQSFHYEQFVTGYTFLLALMLSWRLLIMAGALSTKTISQRLLSSLAIFSLVYSGLSTVSASKAALEDNLVRFKSIHAARRLKQLSESNSGTVLALNPRFADSLPTFSVLPQLWAPHMSVFPGNTATEMKERFFQYLYYSDVTTSMLRETLHKKDHMVLTALFGQGREAPHFSQEFLPVSAEEIDTEVQLYQQYIDSFDELAAHRYGLRYVVASSTARTKNLERWYNRISVEEAGDFAIYTIAPRDKN